MMSQSGVFDPMFTPRTVNSVVPAYTRRTSQYRTGPRITDIASVRAKKPATTKNTAVFAPPASTNVKPMHGEHLSRAPKAHRKHQWQSRNFLPKCQEIGLYGMALIVFIVGLVVSLSGAKTNHQVAAQIKYVQKQAEQSGAKTVIPTATPPNPNGVSNYVVAPNLPRYLDVPALNVHARVLSEGVEKNGALSVPGSIYDTGWYNASSQPGQNGAMLIDGHSGIGKTPGIFSKLASLVVGDRIVVTRGDGQKFTYKVVQVQTVNVKDVDMAGMLVSADTSKPGLNLITCAGDIIPGTTELNKRVLLNAVLQ